MSLPFVLKRGDCLEILGKMDDESIDSIVTDPPYGLKFMSKKWDHEVPSVAIWKECLRVLKPGGHMLVACGTRTQHRMAVNIEDAGFEIRDVISWIYGSGFPKSLDISKAIDKEAGAKRLDLGPNPNRRGRTQDIRGGSFIGDKKIDDVGGVSRITAPATEEAKQWDGWGTALKPACEFWTLARKPLGEKTVAKNLLKHGTGGLNIDGCRVSHSEIIQRPPLSTNKHEGYKRPWNEDDKIRKAMADRKEANADKTQNIGRFPANLILDEEAGEMLDEQSGFLRARGNKTSKKHVAKYNDSSYKFGGWEPGVSDFGGGASRFFYCAKASKKDRGEGNNHPTVKPTKLMEYLCKLITPPNGTVLDPFMGSGSTGVGALANGFRFFGVELSEDYFEIAKNRIQSTGGYEQPDPHSMRIR